MTQHAMCSVVSEPYRQHRPHCPIVHSAILESTNCLSWQQLATQPFTRIVALIPAHRPERSCALEHTSASRMRLQPLKVGGPKNICPGEAHAKVGRS